MTLEEAIKHTEEVAKENEDSAKEYYRIANLEYHPNKKDAENSYIKCTECHKEHRQLAEWLKELKKYREENDWIPCSDRPPEKEGRYLITVDDGDRKDVSDDFFYFRDDGVPSWYVEKNVIAWMPFPEPYRGEQE